MSDENWIAKTIVPKSDQLNADDLITGPIVVTVTDVRQGEADQPVVLVIDGGKQPYKPCKTMRRLLVSLWGERASDWIGKQLRLYADPDVKWGGVAVGGIRISAVSGIEQPHTVMLTESRGKRKAVTIEPLQTQPPKPTTKKQPLTLAERAKAACNAYDECHDASRLETLDTHIDALFADLTNDEDKQAVQVARDAAIARLA